MEKMHESIEKLGDCICHEISKGIENVDTDEMLKVSEIYENLSKGEYHATISKAMKENADEYGETWDEKGKLYTRMRDNRGRYMRGYDEPMMYDERVEQIKNGKMHYQEPMHNESSYDRSKRMYHESKMMNPADKTEHLTKLNKLLDTVEDDFMGIKDNMSAEERTTMRQKLVNLSNKI